MSPYWNEEDPQIILTCQADDGNWQKKNWFPLSEDVWQSAPSTFVHTSSTAALTPAKWMSTSHHFYLIRWYLVDILSRKCHQRKRHAVSIHPLGTVNACRKFTAIFPMLIFLLNKWQICVEGGSPNWRGFIHPLDTVNINLANSCWDIFLWIKVSYRLDICHSDPTSSNFISSFATPSVDIQNLSA